MVSALISRFVILVCGTLYPAYRSYKAVKTKNVREYIKWMMYWIVFALFLCTEAIADIFLSIWFPFYYESKILFVLWLLSPYTKGASFLYRKFVHPTLMKHEKEIDQYLAKAKNESYTRLIRLGNRAISYAREAVALAALRGHDQLLGQLRKTSSVPDVTDSSHSNRRALESVENVQKTKRPEKSIPLRAASPDEFPIADANLQEEQEEQFYGDEDGAAIVEHEFSYLNDDLYADDDESENRDNHSAVSTRSKRRAKDDDLPMQDEPARNSSQNADIYATLPRRSTRSAAKVEYNEN